MGFIFKHYSFHCFSIHISFLGLCLSPCVCCVLVITIERLVLARSFCLLFFFGGCLMSRLLY